jgi:prolyl oligopeptidase
LFGTIPKAKFVVEPVPAFVAPDAPMAYYLWPSADGRRPGTYYINTYKPESRARYQLEALCLHEAVPGHHFQISRAFELDGQPAFRRFSMAGYTAYVEGWALYTESLGDDLGLYTDPYSKFGRLSEEMLRAVRLVVDTGMHHKKWTRQQAIDFAAANCASSVHEIETEIDRYAAWPGQALAYKVGEIQIRELRAKAAKTLGPKFDVKTFHDTVLNVGAVPLDVLTDAVDAWTSGKK